jgi:hypothetical protein
MAELSINVPLTVAAPVQMKLRAGVENACVVQITNPGTATIFIEGTLDAWVSEIDLAGLTTLDNTTVADNSAGSGFTPAAGKNRAYLVPCSACNGIRVRATALTGSPLVSIRSIVCDPLGFMF